MRLLKGILMMILDWLRPSNLRILFFCFLIAFVYWFFNALNRDYTATIRYPVRFVYDKQDYLPYNILPKRIELNVSGYGWTLFYRTLRFTVKPLRIDVKRMGPQFLTAEQMQRLLTRQVGDIRINRIITDTLHFGFDKMLEKEMILWLDTNRVSVKKGLKIDGPVLLQPSKVICRGPSRELAVLPDTLRFGIEEHFVDGNFKEVVRLNYKPGRNVSLNTEKVLVSLKTCH